MDHPSAPTVLSENIIFRDLNIGLPTEARVAAFDKISRLVQHDVDLLRIRVDISRDDQAASDDARFVAKGELDLGGPGLLASVTSDSPLKSLDFLLEKFDRQLRRRRSALRHAAR